MAETSPAAPAAPADPPPPIEAVRAACAALRRSERVCDCRVSPHTLPPCRAAVRVATLEERALRQELAGLWGIGANTRAEAARIAMEAAGDA